MNLVNSFITDIERCLVFSTIVLPLDGLITDTTYLHYECFLDACRSFNITIPNELSFEEQKVFRSHQWLEDIDNLSHQQKEELILEKNRLYNDELDDIDDDDIYPGILALITDAHKQNVLIYAVSDDDLANKLIEQLELPSYINLITSNDLKKVTYDILVIDDLVTLNAMDNKPIISILLSQNDLSYSTDFTIQNTEELTLCFFKKIWEETNDLQYYSR